MSLKQILGAFAGVVVLAGCAASPKVAAVDNDEPKHGAVAPPLAAGGTSENVTPTANVNSDNKSIVTRTGLSSDPNNPSGAAGHPVD